MSSIEVARDLRDCEGADIEYYCWSLNFVLAARDWD